MSQENQELTEGYEISGTLPERAPRYNVDKSSSNWLVTYEDNCTTRLHTSPGFAPYVQFNCIAGKTQHTVKPGQWMTMQLSYNNWARMSDADHR